MYNARRIIGALAGLLALLGLAAAAWFSVLLARADAEFRKGTPEGVARAVELAPRDTAYLSQRALQVEYEGGDSRPLLERIARLNPDSSAARIRLGLDAEVRGDLAGAERWLLDAARVDRQYEPRWTLANFYFRQQRMDEFWKWIGAALEASYGDRTAAFDLCWRAAPDSRIIMARAIPDQHDVVAAFLAYLLMNKAGDAAPVAIRLSQSHDAADLPLLDRELDSLVTNNQRAEAREIWINLGYPDPTAIVFNPDFGPPRVGHGFDWRLIQNPGVTNVSLDTPPSLRISFNGMQPESCVLLNQYSGDRKGKRYLLRWESRGVSSGIAWRVGAVNAPLLAGSDWTRGQLLFVAAQDSDLVELFYHRPLGEPRVEGSVELRHVVIDEQ
jgi:tetratricopeptide (TPR) repeat protein